MKPLPSVRAENIRAVGAVVLVLGLLLLVPALHAQPATNSNRFLLILDSSAGMKPFETPRRDATFDLIYSGVRGQMTNGDTYGLWLAGEQNDTSFPMESWKQKFAVELAAKAALHVKDRGCQGRPGLDAALADARRVVQTVGDLTVILISNGETPLTGTPFDEAINARFRELAPQMKLKKMTLNTVLVARDGEFVAWAVNSPDFLLEVPSVPPRRAKVQVAAATTNAPAPKAEAIVEKPRVAVAPIIMTKETVAAEKRSYLAATTVAPVVSDLPAKVSVTNPVETNVISATASNGVTATVITAAVETSAVNPVPKPTVSAAVVAVATNLPPTNVLAVVVAPAQTNLAVALAEPPPVKPALPSATTSSNNAHSLLWAGAGGGTVLVIFLAVMIIVRSRRAQPSLISQALMRERVG